MEETHGSAPETQAIHHLLQTASRGDRRAAESLVPLLYDDLLRMAQRKMRNEPAGHTLQATDLVHEAYARLVGRADPGWDHAGHFFAAAAEAMRRILVERARRVQRPKHAGDRERVDLDSGIASPADNGVDVLDLNAAIEDLEADDPRKGRIAVLRCFAGFTPKETAAALDVSLSTVEREWRFTKAWLQQKLDGGLPD